MTVGPPCEETVTGGKPMEIWEKKHNQTKQRKALGWTIMDVYKAKYDYAMSSPMFVSTKYGAYMLDLQKLASYPRGISARIHLRGCASKRLCQQALLVLLLIRLMKGSLKVQ